MWKFEYLIIAPENDDEKLNTSGSTGSGTTFYFDYQGGKFGYNTSSSRGADTFSPFSRTSEIYNALVAKGVTPASDSVTDIVTAINNMAPPFSGGAKTISASVSVPQFAPLLSSVIAYGSASVTLTVAPINGQLSVTSGTLSCTSCGGRETGSSCSSRSTSTFSVVNA